MSFKVMGGTFLNCEVLFYTFGGGGQGRMQITVI